MGQVDAPRGGHRGYVADAQHTEIGFEQITGLSSVKGLTAGTYDGATMALIQAEDQNVRWRSDGTNPSTSVGHVLHAGNSMRYMGTLSAIKFIEETASAKLNVSYFLM